jgi:amidohydrolase
VPSYSHVTSIVRLLTTCLLTALLFPAPSALALDPSPLASELDARLEEGAGRMLEWRRHLHQHPELSNRESETALYLAERLRAMGLEPETGIAHHGLRAVIEGGLPGRTVALRADMDALPVEERSDLPFASRATGTFGGRTVPVMHACGHDAHMAMLLAAAEALVGVRERLPGRVVLIFQPAEEGVPTREKPAGAEAMVAEGVLENPDVDAIFGLHVTGNAPRGILALRPGPILAAHDRFEISVAGRQTHGSRPWDGVDPIVTASEIVIALQTIVARGVDLTREPAVVSVGKFESGVRSNIIPERARLVGTIRTYDPPMRDEIHARLRRIAENVAEAHGATAEVTIDPGYPVTVNDPALTAAMMPTLERIAPGRVRTSPKITGAEDFAFYAREVPGLFAMLGVTSPDQFPGAASNHSPDFFVDEGALPTGARALAHLATDYLFAHAD